MKKLAATISTVFALAAVTFAAAQSPTAQLAFAPASSSATVGASVAVDVTIADVAASPGLGGYAVDIAFNPAVVRMDSLTDAGVLANSVALCLPGQINNTAGTATIGCSPLFSLGGFSTMAPVALLHASFTALAAGTSPLDLTGSTLQSPANAAIAVGLSKGAIVVTAPQAATATPGRSSTPAPTATATPSPSATATSGAATEAATPGDTGASPTAGLPQSVVETVVASALGAPNTGTGGGSHGMAWALAAAVTAIALALAGGVAFLRGRRGRAT
ncbi:MAG TPA: hypothetical protein VEZ14_03655 [Dehalococcoidia bacterium]|nr:hypothetical protein [Dehalococcoidia bacterium]